MQKQTKARRQSRAVLIIGTVVASMVPLMVSAEAAVTPPGGIASFPAGGELPSGITAGVDGNLWIGDIFGTEIHRVTPTGTVTAFDDPANHVEGPTALASSTTDQKVWFASAGNNRVGNIVVTGPGTGTITTFTNASVTHPVAIAQGGDGNMWFAHDAGIGRITPGGVITNFTSAAIAGGADQITADVNGDLFFTDMDDNLVGRVNVEDGVVSTFPVPANMHEPYGITAGPGNQLWFGSITSGRIGTMSSAGAFGSSHAVPSIVLADGALATGPDGNVWFHSSRNRIGRITAGGVVSSYFADGAISTATGLTTGPDGNMWFTSAFTNEVGFLVPDGVDRPDGSVGAAPGGPFKGDNEYATVAGDSAQTQSQTVARGGSATVFVNVGNDSSVTDSFAVRAVENSGATITVKYLNGSENITTAVHDSGGYLVENLAPGASVQLKIKFKASASAGPGQSRRADVTVTSVGDPAVRDVVRAKART